MITILSREIKVKEYGFAVISLSRFVFFNLQFGSLISYHDSHPFLRSKNHHLDPISNHFYWSIFFATIHIPANPYLDFSLNFNFS